MKEIIDRDQKGGMGRQEGGAMEGGSVKYICRLEQKESIEPDLPVFAFVVYLFFHGGLRIGMQPQQLQIHPYLVVLVVTVVFACLEYLGTERKGGNMRTENK